jgi:hypothetical protein
VRLVGGTGREWVDRSEGWLLLPILASALSPSAMSSYLYIIKSELPLVIQTFLNLEEQTS